MKILIEDYQRRLKTITKTIETTTDTGSRNDIAKMARLNAKASEYRTFIAEMERELRKGVSIYDLWVVQIGYGDRPETVYHSKEEAEMVALMKHNEYKDSIRKANEVMSDSEFEDHYKNAYAKYLKYKVRTLDDALYEYGEACRDEHLLNEEP